MMVEDHMAKDWLITMHAPRSSKTHFTVVFKDIMTTINVSYDF